MKNSILVSLVVFAICSACSNERETASGQKFTIAKKGDGKEIKAKQIMVMDFSFKDGKDSVWFDTRKNPYPQIMQKQAQPQNGDALLEVIYMLTKGDSAVVKMSAVDVFTKAFRQPIPPKVDTTSFFTFFITMKDAMDSLQFTKYREELVAKQNEKALKQEKEQLSKDSVIIANFLKEKNITAMTTPSGLRYVITKPGIGENAKDGQTAKVNYAGYLLNGKCFDTSIESVAKEKNTYQQGRSYAPFPVPVGQGRVIKGWDEALKLMNKGCKMTVYIPSSLAYGPQKRSEDIIENSILAFDMEVVDIQ
ncbi:MAG TPA: FKBP-type peptidyl-prolyl cis-trans isomerase [Cyclobacteriaceae bacterium]|jgi:FKBP-type peptidyl-prolyl cis-trans isomerase|nr:FKBP-type peptidyl-prolyl cis-trans isomerase [Cyclobacteriaceae bacterium]